MVSAPGASLEWEHRFEPGFPAFVSVARGAARLFLSEHTGDARPGTPIYLRPADLSAIAHEFGTAVESDADWMRTHRSRQATRYWMPL